MLVLDMLTSKRGKMTSPSKTLRPRNRQQWRNWLEKNHTADLTVWVVCTKRNASRPAISYPDAVLEALCFGWIDGKTLSLDAERFMQSFTKRKPRSAWSGLNKERVKQLISEGLMTPAGLDQINAAKQNGYWWILDEVEARIIPEDLEAAFRKHPAAKAGFARLSPSMQKLHLQSLVLAKRPETRQKRIADLVAAMRRMQS